MNIIDKYQAKRLGVSEERYIESEKTASTIWKILFCEGKVIAPFMHIRMNVGLVAVEFLFGIAVVNCTLLFCNKIYGLGMLESGLLLIAIASMSLFLIEKFLIYCHDMKQFHERLEEIVKWEKEHGVTKFIVPIKKHSINNEEIVREVIIQTETAERARIIAIGDFQHDGWFVDLDCENYKQLKG